MSEQNTAAAGGMQRGPRIRWGAIIWGALFATVAGWVLLLMVDAEHRALIADAIVHATPFTALMWCLLAAGGLILVGGLVALIRRAQRSRGRAIVSAPADTAGHEAKPQDAQQDGVGIHG